jgi:hypothetical protein
MRPQSITMFDRLFLGSLGLGLVNAALNYDSTIGQLEADPAVAELGMAGPGFVIAILAFSFGLSLLLWFLISRMAVNVAKWVLVVLTVIGLFGIPLALVDVPLPQAIITVVVTVTQLAALWFLFRPDAKAWFEHGPKGMDSSTFE